jgi:DNA-binding SARP family transcriptional activator
MRLQLLRTPQWLHADGSATPLNARDAGLLALLALDGPTTRDRAIALLWPEEDEPSRARNALRQRLFRLRRTAGFEVVGADELLLLAPQLQHDLQDPATALAADPAARTGELLGSLAYPAQAAFAEWLDAARARWRSRRADALAQLASQREAEDRIAEALPLAERLVRDEPLLEHAHRRLMRLHYRRGDRAAALAAYAQLQQALQLQLGQAPAEETQALAELVQRSGPLPVAAGPVPAAVLRPPRLVGRALEWQQIEQGLARGLPVLVAGEPGAGKSRLLADFAGSGWLAVAARPGDAGLPHALLARLLAALLAPLAADAAWPDGVRGELARLLPALGEPAAGPLQPPRLQQAVLHALQRLQPAGVVVDDLQFADEATLALLPGLVAAGGRPWLLALRPQEQPPTVGSWLQAQPHVLVRLAPLGVAAVTELLQTLALPGLEPAAWAPRLHRHSGGNPLFLLETLRLLAVGPPQAPGDALPLPDTLRQLLERRLAALSPPALKLAQVAALAGSDFSVDLAAQVLEVHALDLQAPWQEAERQQLMAGTAFVHDLVLEATRDAVPQALRQWLHGRIARALAAHDGSAARCALHWRAAGEPAAAAQAFDHAATQAQAAGRLAEQTRWLEAAVACHQAAGQGDQAFELRVRLCIAAREAMSPQAALQQADALLEAATTDAQLAHAHLQLASCLSNNAQFAQSLPEFERAIAAATAAGEHELAQQSRYRAAMACAYVHGLPDALRRLEPLQAWADGLADESLRCCFLSDFAIVLDQSDQRRRALPLFERALAHFDRQGEVGNATPTRAMFARSLISLGRLQRALPMLERAVRDRRALSEGDGGMGVEALNLARVYCELGRYADVLTLLPPWVERLAGPDAEVSRAAMALVLARVHQCLGQPARAQAAFAALPAQLPFHQQASALWTRALLAAERPAERQHLLDEALAQFAQTDLPFLRLPIQFDQLAGTPGDAAVAGLRAAVAECEKRELPAPQMLGRLRLVQVLGRLDRRREALDVARGLVDDLAQCHPVCTYLPELHAACAQAALAGGDLALAARCHDAAVQWVALVSQTQVPAAFRESFAQRNPVNRALLTATLGPR